MSDAARLFCLDTVLIDLVLRVDALPERAGDALASEQLVAVGGGFNAMSAAARHDMDVVYAGRLGEGPFTSLALAALAREGVSTPVERHEALDIGVCVVLLERDGERTFVTSPGAEATLRRHDLDALDPQPGDYVVVSGYNVMYPGSAETVLGWVGDLTPGVTVVFDPATRVADIPSGYLAQMVARTNWLTCNADEARVLAPGRDAAACAQSLASMFSTCDVVVRDGARGCVVALRDSPVVAVNGFVVPVVDTNGAGDVHTGVFVARLASGEEPTAAARWANAAAAMAIGRRGPATGPRLEEVTAWMARATPGAPFATGAR